eukprot:5261941-Pyramimonas_sp.AAC.1
MFHPQTPCIHKAPPPSVEAVYTRNWTVITTTCISAYSRTIRHAWQGLPVVLQESPLLGELEAGTSRPGLLRKWTFDYLASAL